MSILKKKVKSGDVISTLENTVTTSDLMSCNKHSIYASADVTVEYKIGYTDEAYAVLSPPTEAANGFADSPIWNQNEVAEIRITANADGTIVVKSYVDGIR